MSCISEGVPLFIEDPHCKIQTWVASDDFYLSILQPFDPRKVHRAIDELLNIRKGLSAVHRLNREQLAMLHSLSRVSSADHFTAHIDTLYTKYLVDSFKSANFINLCLQLFAKGVILFPRNTVGGGDTIFTPKYKNQSIPIKDYNVKEISQYIQLAKINSRSKAKSSAWCRAPRRGCSYRTRDDRRQGLAARR